MSRSSAKNPAGEGPAETLGFEDAYRALDGVVERLESDELSLDAALDLYARGVALAERCQALLAAAETRLREVDAEGRPGAELPL